MYCYAGDNSRISTSWPYSSRICPSNTIRPSPASVGYERPSASRNRTVSTWPERVSSSVESPDSPQARSKAAQAGVAVEWSALVEQVLPGTPLWDEVVPRLAAERLNAEADRVSRWATDCVLLRLSPVQDV